MINESVAGTISVNKSSCVSLSATWTNCTINQEVLSCKLTSSIHWCLWRQSRKVMTSSNWSLSVTEHEDYLFFDFFKLSGWMISKKVCLSCICTEGFAVQIMALCPSPLQYRHRLCCIQRVFSATDSGSRRQGWATERFIGSSLVVRTETY